mgnify:CR=1 FL=1
MKIEINEPGSEAFYKETVNAAAQYRYILKDHSYKLKDYFRHYRTLLTVALIVLAANVAEMLLWGAGTAQLVASGVLLAASLMCSAYLFSLKKSCRTMMADPRASVLSLDDGGVELKVEDTQTVRIAKSNIAVIRVFSECLCFVPAAGAGVIISVDRKYEEEITRWVRENWPETEMKV